MSKTISAIVFFIFFFHSVLFSQCITPLPAPDCNGTEPLITDGETISGGVTKWYYGSAASINDLTVDGGTLVVCGNLTIDKFYITTGKIFIRPGGHLVIAAGIGSGLQFKGDCAIYNYGTFELQRNLTLENNATATTPNIVYNALASSVFLMGNQYFVISNSYSWFINNGRAEFWGIITDQQSVASSVCLGNGSSTKMAILINKVADTYSVPSGSACLNVYQYSEFYGQLTSSPNLFACLGGSHTSNSSCIPFGCHPNYWGAAQLFTNCTGCASVNLTLPVRFISLDATNNGNETNTLQWRTSSDISDGYFTVLRSADGKQFIPLDSIKADNKNIFSFTDQHPLEKTNYYMIRYSNIQTGTMLNSVIAKVIAKIKNSLNIYPVPFYDKFIINYERGSIPQKLLLKDTEGRTIRTYYTIYPESRSVEVRTLDNIPKGLYIIYMETDKSFIAKPTLKY